LRVEAVRFAAPAPAAMRGIDAWAIAGLFAGLVPQLALVAGAVVLALLGARPAYAVLVRVVEAAGVRNAARESAGLPPARVRGALAGEPPHVAAAVISALPAATAAAVLELYPPEERAQIVRRLARAANDLVPHAEELLRARG
jgi:flagellar motor switch protein FliG